MRKKKNEGTNTWYRMAQGNEKMLEGGEEGKLFGF